MKKYRISGSFTYRGPDGRDKRSVILAPGEEVPKLNSEERDKLLRMEKISEVDQYGETIRYRKLGDLNDDQIEGLLKRPHAFVMSYLAGLQGSSRPLSKETLSKMFSIAEQRKLAPPLIKQLEKYLSE